MITQLSGTCYEYTPGSFNVRFLDDPATAPPISIHPSRPASPAPEPSAIRYTREQIQPLRDILEPILARVGRFDLCGSYRRGKPTVKDLDYIIETTHEGFAHLRDTLTAAGVTFHRGAGEIMFGVLHGVGVEFYRADPSSYTSVLIWRTGSMEHNVYCARVARRKGLRIRRVGIEMRNGAMVHPGTEQDFYRILGVEFIAPEDRDVEG